MIPFVDLKAQYESIKPEIDEAIQKVINSSQFIMGEELEAFEEEFAAYCGTKYCVGTSSGTSALMLALKACGIGQGDKVITVANSYVATAEAIVHVGAKPVFVDICGIAMATDKIETVINEKTKAIMPVHIYGEPAFMGAINEIAIKHGLKVIEDACQAHGAIYNYRRLPGMGSKQVVGGLGDIGCFSFYPGKNLGAMGDGGAIVTNDRKLAFKVSGLTNHGCNIAKYHHTEIGYTHRLDNLQAAILRVKLKYLDGWNEKRRQHAQHYEALLMTAGLNLLKTPGKSFMNEEVFHLYVIRTKQRQEIIKAFQAANIQHGIHYPVPIHLQPAFQYLGYKRGDLPITEQYADEILSLPMYPELTESQQEQVVNVIKSVVGTTEKIVVNA